MYIKKFFQNLLQVYDVWIWCLLKLLKCRMMALSLCCQGLVFVTLVTKMWVNGFGARSTVTEVLVTLSRDGAAKRFGFNGGGEGRHAILI